MAGSTQFPEELDTFPAISPTTAENEAGKEHDVVHNNVHAAVLALQEKVGVDESEDPASLDARVAALESAPGGSQPGVTFILDTGADLQNGDSELAEFAPSDKGPWSGWSMQITPAGGTVELDVLVDGVSITTGGSKPTVTTGSTNTGDLSGWAGDSVAAGESMEVSVFAVSGSVERVALYLHP